MSIARNSATILVTQIISLGLGIFTSMVVARALGPSNRGVYFLVLSTTALVIGLANCGIDFTATYLLAKGKYRLKEVNANALIIVLVISAMVLLVYLPGRGLLRDTLFRGIEEPFVLYALLMIPFALYTRYWGAMMLGLNRIWLMNQLEIATGVVGALCGFVVLVILGWGIWGLLGQGALFALALTAVRLFLVWKIDGLKFGLNLKLLRESLHFGFRGQVGNFAGVILLRADSYIVNYFIGAVGVGYYSLASSLAQRLSMLTSPITTAANPVITRSGREESGRLTAQVLRHSALLVIAGALALVAAGPWLVPLLYGDEFLPAVEPLRILALGLIPETVALIIAVYITGQLGKPEIGSVVAWLDLILFVPLSMYLTGTMGFTGTALALSGTYLFDGLVFIVLFHVKSGQRLRDFLLIQPRDISTHMTTVSRITSRLFAPRNIQ
ncbi:MAG: oligosaccharide flippase family protein [Chloroflexi bacterium]|nr:oligosaccharide flippase family protein [Chloroflexota bacterium]